jgi:phosphoglycolate phosphatase-like HAD superfamily hydrolase
MRDSSYDLDRRTVLGAMLAATAGAATFPALAQTDPLAAWNDGPTKTAITDFVWRVTAQGGPDFVPVEQRIATFDNDGTMWVEQPMYVQLAFVFDRVKALAPQHPDWKDKQPFKAALEGDMRALAEAGERGLMELMATTHAGMTAEEFTKIVSDWFATARDPRFKRPHTELVYQPMLELLAYLRAGGFKTFIVSGGGIEFMRPWTERVYGIPRAGCRFVNQDKVRDA